MLSGLDLEYRVGVLDAGSLREEVRWHARVPLGIFVSEVIARKLL